MNSTGFNVSDLMEGVPTEEGFVVVEEQKATEGGVVVEEPKVSPVPNGQRIGGPLSGVQRRLRQPRKGMTAKQVLFSHPLVILNIGDCCRGKITVNISTGSFSVSLCEACVARNLLLRFPTADSFANFQLSAGNGGGASRAAPQGAGTNGGAGGAAAAGTNGGAGGAQGGATPQGAGTAGAAQGSAFKAREARQPMHRGAMIF